MGGAMGLVQRIAHQIGLPVEERGALVLVKLLDAKRLLDGCEKEGVRVLGIEGFTFDGNSLIPDMDAIADYSGIASAVSSIKVAREFIECLERADLVLDFSLESSEEIS